MGVKRFVWDEVSDNVLLETDETDAVTARYCQCPERFGELLFQDRSGTKSFFHYDGNSSTCNLTDSSESVTDTTLYTAFGEEVSSSGSTTNPFGYKGAVGYYTNESTSDIYVRNRSYEPSAGRWMSNDSVGFIDGTNLYRAYFVNIGVDPTGKITITRAPHNDDNLSPNCGELGFIAYKFELDKPAPCNGYFVQKITEYCSATSCNDCPPSLPDKPSYVFWEAFPVRVGEKVSEYHKWKGLSDTSQETIVNDICFISKTKKELRFYCRGPKRFGLPNEADTGDLGWVGENPDDPNSTWRINQRYESEFCIGTAGVLPSTSVPPDFWNENPIEGTVITFDRSEWYCCGVCPYVNFDPHRPT